ncbi:hypothetical protein As57867_007039, partial [Aphanomyces stellatus]
MDHYTVQEVLLVSGEATWVVYVVQDLLVAFVSDYSYVAAPISSSLAWSLIFLVEITSPIKASITLERTCATLVSAKQISCNSGVVEFGRFGRAVTILAVQAGSVLLVYSIAVVRRWRRRVPPMSLLISGSAEAYLDPLNDHTTTMSFDTVTCVMCGLLVFHFRSTKYVFDLKSWVVFNMSESNRVSPATLSTAPTDKNNESRPFGLWHRAVAFGGLGYMISSLSGSILYISSMELNMANDFWWAHFNTTGTHAYLGNWYSRQLLFNPNEFSDTLDQAKYGDDNQYNTSSSAISVSQLYPKIAQFEATKNIENAIQGLRQM